MFASQGMCEGCGAQSSDVSSGGYCPDCQSDLYESESREAIIRPEATIDLWNLKTAVDEQASMGACTKCGDLYAPESFDEGLCPECEYARDWFDDQAIEGRHEGSITNLRKDGDDYTATCECGNTLYCDPPEYYDDDPYGIWYACSQCGLDGWLGEGEFKTASRKMAGYEDTYLDDEPEYMPTPLDEANEGVTQCFCGSKYWENGACIDCGISVTKIPGHLTASRKTAVNDIQVVDCLDCGWSTNDSDTINTADYKNECPECGSDDLEFLVSNNGVTLVPTERRLAQRHEGHRRTAEFEYYEDCPKCGTAYPAGYSQGGHCPACATKVFDQLHDDIYSEASRKTAQKTDNIDVGDLVTFDWFGETEAGTVVEVRNGMYVIDNGATFTVRFDDIINVNNTDRMRARMLSSRKTASGDWSYYEGNGYSTWSKNAGSYILQVDGYNDGTYNWKCDPLLRQGASPREYGDGLNGVTRDLDEALQAAEQAISGRLATRKTAAHWELRGLEGAWYLNSDRSEAYAILQNIYELTGETFGDRWAWSVYNGNFDEVSYGTADEMIHAQVDAEQALSEIEGYDVYDPYYEASRKTASPVKFPSKCKVCGDSIAVGQGDVRKVNGAWYTTCDAHKPAPSSYEPRKVTMTNGSTTIQVDPDDVHDAKRDGFWQV